MKAPSLLPRLRVHRGVLVAAKMPMTDLLLKWEFITGDVIYAVNGKTIADMASLGAVLGLVVADSPLVLQVERSGKCRSSCLKASRTRNPHFQIQEQNLICKFWKKVGSRKHQGIY
jgi:hypothetical protein